MKPSKQQLISGLLQQEKLAVISSINVQNMPQSALVAFVEDEELCLYFQTGKHTRKAQNLKHSPAVSMTFGLAESKVTVQYEGLARQLTNPLAIEKCKQRFLAKDSPTTKKYLERPVAIFFKITPAWIRYSDYSKSLYPMIFEVDFLQT